MPESLVDLEHQRHAILQQMLRLPDFRSGSITATWGTCGKANCRCHQPRRFRPGADGKASVSACSNKEDRTCDCKGPVLFIAARVPNGTLVAAEGRSRSTVGSM